MNTVAGHALDTHEFLEQRGDTTKASIGRRRVHLRHILSFRSFVLLTFVLFLLSGPVPTHSDLFAAVLGYSLLAVIALIIVLTFVAGWWYRSDCEFSVTHDLSKFPDDKAISGHPITVTIRPRSVGLLPFFSLWITPHFRGGPVQTSTWRVTGWIGKNQQLSQTIVFPHRGQWELLSLHIELRDTFGLSRFSWDYSGAPSLTSIMQYPPVSGSHQIPPFTIETTSGTEVTEIHRTEGEPFDIKRYHPSDGIKKILWKVYAKSGELLSRHPEPSMTPEGTVSLYVCASRFDDPLASIALAHIRELENNLFEVMMISDGAPLTKCATNSSESELLLIESAWKSDNTDHAERMKRIDLLDAAMSQKNQRKMSSLTLFISSANFSKDTFLQEMQFLGETLSKREIIPLWILVEEDQHQMQTEPSKLKDLFFEHQRDPHKQFSVNHSTHEQFREFMNVCNRFNWKYFYVSGVVR